MRDLEMELQIAQLSLEEATESFSQLSEDYQILRKHTDTLEELLRANGIEFPEFWGW